MGLSSISGTRTRPNQLLAGFLLMVSIPYIVSQGTIDTAKPLSPHTMHHRQLNLATANGQTYSTIVSCIHSKTCYIASKLQQLALQRQVHSAVLRNVYK
jgi:hypothetical protein